MDIISERSFTFLNDDKALTNDFETAVLLIKYSVGTGVLTIHHLYPYAGLWMALFMNYGIGCLMVYAMHILVRSAQELCLRESQPSMLYDRVAESAFEHGPPLFRKFSKSAGHAVNVVMCLNAMGICCVQVVFVAKNIKQVVDYFYIEIDVRYYMAILLPLLIPMNQIKSIKILAHISLFANIAFLSALAMCYFYLLRDIPHINSRPAVADIDQIPLYIGCAIFCAGGIGIVLYLEKNMENPEHLVTWNGILNYGMLIIVTIHAMTGFVGYLKYGDDLKESITLNIPQDEIMPQCVKLIMALAIFLSFNIQFFIVINIMWSALETKFPNHANMCYTFLTTILIFVVLVISVVIPDMGPLVSLVGTVCLSYLGLVFPAIIDLLIIWRGSVPNLFFYLRVFADGFILIFGMIAFVIGTYFSILDIIKVYGSGGFGQ